MEVGELRDNLANARRRPGHPQPQSSYDAEFMQTGPQAQSFHAYPWTNLGKQDHHLVSLLCSALFGFVRPREAAGFLTSLEGRIHSILISGTFPRVYLMPRWHIYLLCVYIYLTYVVRTRDTVGRAPTYIHRTYYRRTFPPRISSLLSSSPPMDSVTRSLECKQTPRIL
jgi:hypothetical protein